MDKYGAREFSVRFRINNAAFEDDAEPAEIARILRELAGRIQDAPSIYEGSVRDSNGNTVGAWWRDDPPDEADDE